MAFGAILLLVLLLFATACKLKLASHVTSLPDVENGRASSQLNELIQASSSLYPNAASTTDRLHTLPNTSLASSPSSPQQRSPSRDVSPGRVFIWMPGGDCMGSFISTSAQHASSGTPYAMLREAVIDRRVAANNHFLENNKKYTGIPFVRVVFHVTVHLSVRLSAVNSTAEIKMADGSASNKFSLHVDYVMQTEPWLNRVAPQAYRPGMTNQKGYTVAEWQVSVSVLPRGGMDIASRRQLVDRLIELSQSDNGTTAKLFLSLRAIRFDNAVFSFEPWMTLSCVMGWVMPDAYPPLPRLRDDAPPPCERGVDKTDGAILFSGSFLHGVKNRDPKHFAEIAHFAARALHGPLKFTTVLMSVLPRHSVTDIKYRCADDLLCMRAMHAENIGHLEGIREAVEREFDALGMSRSSYGQLIIAPGCRLGSHASGTEKTGGPCSASFWHAQYVASLYAYSMLSPFYKWAVSYDLDEMVMGKPSSLTWFNRFMQAGPAAQLLDAADAEHAGYFTFGWLNFLASGAAARNLTHDVMQGRPPALKPKAGDATDTARCWKGWTTGKAAVRCDIGVGFTIHSPLIMKSSLGRVVPVVKPAPRLSSSFRTWHPRLQSTSGMCAYVHV